mgnify:CR=1 FL=1
MSAFITYGALALAIGVQNFYIAPLLGKGNEDFFKWHTLFQCLIFLFVAHIPAYRTGVMWFVDIAWPAGLIFIGAHTLYSLAHTWKAYAICGCVLFQGGRMFMGGCQLVMKGIWTTDKDIQRYVY